MQRILTYTVLLAIMLVTGGCSSSNFLVYKDAKHFYVTSKGNELKQVLCDSGDMDKIVVDSKLPEAMQKELKDGICASNKNRERLMASLDAMTKEQRTAFKDAFRANGYDINVVVNC